MSTLAIDIQALRFSWPDATQLQLDIPAWQVTQGQRVFLHGPSGSGKSTLLALLGGVNVAQAGRCSVLGQDLSRLNSATRDGWRADHVGFIFQQFNLIPYLSVLANVTLPCRLSARRRIRGGGDVITTAQQLLQRVGLSETLWHKPAMLLSIGQQQRVAAARALIGQPELVIADEPTSALDAARQQDFLSLLAEVCSEAGATLVYVSHDARLAAEFDTVIALNDINKAAHV